MNVLTHPIAQRRAPSEEAAKKIIHQVVLENFFPELRASNEVPNTAALQAQAHHLVKVVEWFYASLMRKEPWSNWTNDIYDAMRCIDHLPIH